MNPQRKIVHWSATVDVNFPYEAEVEGRRWQLQLGDFPAEALYTLLIDGQQVATFDDWPAAWIKPLAPKAKAKYYLVNDRPVRFIPTAKGGMDIQALNMRTGSFERAMEYLTKVMEPFADVDSVTEAEFEARVAEVRAKRG